MLFVVHRYDNRARTISHGDLHVCSPLRTGAVGSLLETFGPEHDLRVVFPVEQGALSMFWRVPSFAESGISGGNSSGLSFDRNTASSTVSSVTGMWTSKVVRARSAGT